MPQTRLASRTVSYAVELQLWLFVAFFAFVDIFVTWYGITELSLVEANIIPALAIGELGLLAMVPLKLLPIAFGLAVSGYLSRDPEKAKWTFLIPLNLVVLWIATLSINVYYFALVL